MLTQEGALKRTKTSSDTTGRDGKAGLTDIDKHSKNGTGDRKRSKKNPVQLFMKERHRYDAPC